MDSLLVVKVGTFMILLRSMVIGNLEIPAGAVFKEDGDKLSLLSSPCKEKRE